MTVKVQVFDPPLRVAVTTTGVDASTPAVVTPKVAVVAPPATVTDAGTVTALLAELRVTVTPPVGAAPERVTVPPDGTFPPTMLVGEIATLEIPEP